MKVTDPEKTIKDARRAKRAAGVAAGAGRRVFRAGTLWGRTTQTARSTARRAGRDTDAGTLTPYVAAGCAGVTVGAAGVYFLDPHNGKRRRHVARDRTMKLLRRGARKAEAQARYAAETAGGKVEPVTTPSRPAERRNDPALARKVESEIFRDEEAPKGEVNINVEDGVVYLRGQLDSEEWIRRLIRDAIKVEGVREVESLLHLPGQPPPAKPERVAAAERVL